MKRYQVQYEVQSGVWRDAAAWDTREEAFQDLELSSFAAKADWRVVDRKDDKVLRTATRMPAIPGFNCVEINLWPNK